MNKRFAATGFAATFHCLPERGHAIEIAPQVYKHSNPERFKHPHPAIRPIRIGSDGVLGEVSHETSNRHSMRTDTTVAGGGAVPGAIVIANAAVGLNWVRG